MWGSRKKTGMKIYLKNKRTYMIHPLHLRMFAFEAEERGLSYGKYVAATENPVTVEPAPVKYKTAYQRAAIRARRERRKRIEKAKTESA